MSVGPPPNLAGGIGFPGTWDCMRFSFQSCTEDACGALYCTFTTCVCPPAGVQCSTDPFMRRCSDLGLAWCLPLPCVRCGPTLPPPPWGTSCCPPEPCVPCMPWQRGNPWLDCCPTTCVPCGGYPPPGVDCCPGGDPCVPCFHGMPAPPGLACCAPWGGGPLPPGHAPGLPAPHPPMSGLTPPGNE